MSVPFGSFDIPAAGLRAFSEEYFRGHSGALRTPWGAHGFAPGGWGAPVHVGAVIELRGPLPVDPSIPATAAATAAAAASEGKDVEAEAAAAARAAGARWTDPHLLPHKLSQQQLLHQQQLLQQFQQQPHQPYEDLLLPDYGSLSFMHVDFGVAAAAPADAVISGALNAAVNATVAVAALSTRHMLKTGARLPLLLLLLQRGLTGSW